MRCFQSAHDGLNATQVDKIAANDAEALAQDVHACLMKPFPNGVLTVENELDIELIGMDSAIAGCLSTFLGGGAGLDIERIDILRETAASLALILPRLEGEIEEYFACVWTTADRVLAFLDNRSLTGNG